MTIKNINILDFKRNIVVFLERLTFKFYRTATHIINLKS